MTTDFKRAPAPTWPVLRRALSSLEIGEEGVVRLPIEPAPPEGWELALHTTGDHPERTWYSLTTHQRTSRTCPLTPGAKAWVPEEWWCSRVGLDRERLWRFEFRQRGVCPWPVRVVRMPEGWSPGKAYGWRSPYHLPARAARLACEVGEVGVEKGTECPDCGGHGFLEIDPPLYPCHTCKMRGTAGEEPHWIIRVQRVEVSV